MPSYKYKALTEQGSSATGFVTADNEKHACQIVRGKGLKPIEFTVDSEPKSKSPQTWLKPKLSISELSLFTRELSTLLEAGMALDESLLELSETPESKYMEKFIGFLRSSLSEGNTFSKSIELSPFNVPRDFTATVLAGESSGKLDKVLLQLADTIEKQYSLERKAKSAMIYPALMISISILVVFFLMIFIVPKISAVFVGMGRELPPLTVFMLNLSDFLQFSWPYILTFILFSIFFINKGLRNEGFRFKYHLFLLRIPFMGKLKTYSNTAKWSRTLAVLISSGVPAKEYIRISAEVVDSEPFKRAILNMVSEVDKGSAIHLVMKKNKVFPRLITNLVRTGEGKGNEQLAKMFYKGAAHYEDAFETASDAFTSVLEPILIVVMGGVVLTIVLAVLLPIFEMNKITG